MSNSKYNLVTWLVAIILAIYLFWQWQNNHGMGACCSVPVATAPTAEPLAPAPIADAFKCRATADKFESSGDASTVTWLSKSAELSNWLKAGGADWVATCNDASVVLSGTVESDAAKTKASADALAFFGDKVTVDNQLSVSTSNKTIEPANTVTAPATVNLYFDTGKTKLSSEAENSLLPIAEWLKANPNAKAVISGYHDPRGNKAINAELAKNRAKAVSAVLKLAGVDETRIEMRKPADTDGGGDLSQARRVEVSVE